MTDKEQRNKGTIFSEMIRELRCRLEMNISDFSRVTKISRQQIYLFEAERKPSINIESLFRLIDLGLLDCSSREPEEESSEEFVNRIFNDDKKALALFINCLRNKE